MTKSLTLRLVSLLMLPFAIALLLSSCEPTTIPTASTGSLSLVASMPDIGAQKIARSPTPARTTFPTGVDLSTLSYSLMLTNSTSASPISGGTSSSGSFTTVTMIPQGTWTATVTAAASGVPVGTGNATVVIAAEATTTTTINLAPPSTGAGNVVLSSSWSFPAVSTLVITPVNPSGTAQTIVSPAAITTFSTTLSLAAGIYHIGFSLATTNGTITTVQSGASDTIYVLSGCTTSLNYTFPDTSYKLPSLPTVNACTGYNSITRTYAYVSWSGAARATSYTLERKSASTQAGLDGATYPATPLATALGSTVFGYTDSDSGTGLGDNWYRYRLTAANSAGSCLPVERDATTLRNLTLLVGGGAGTVSPPGTTQVRLGASTNIIATAVGTFIGWTVTGGNATIAAPLSLSTNVVLSSDATVAATFAP